MLEKKLSIITIAYEENQDLFDTYDSLKSLLQFEINWILVVNRPLISFVVDSKTKLVQGQDNGLYDAINIGISLVETEYFMLLHAGDKICDSASLMRAIGFMKDGYDCILGGSVIGKRKHKSRYWKPWMLKFYVQPPHLPIIYRTNSCKGYKYNISIRTVADFYLLKEIFLVDKLKYYHSNETYISMGTGGLTTSGFKSLLHVTFAFIDVDGVKPLLFSPIRILLKLIVR